MSNYRQALRLNPEDPDEATTGSVMDYSPIITSPDAIPLAADSASCWHRAV